MSSGHWWGNHVWRTRFCGWFLRLASVFLGAGVKVGGGAECNFQILHNPTHLVTNHTHHWKERPWFAYPYVCRFSQGPLISRATSLSKIKKHPFFGRKMNYSNFRSDPDPEFPCPPRQKLLSTYIKKLHNRNSFERR